MEVICELIAGYNLRVESDQFSILEGLVYGADVGEYFMWVLVHFCSVFGASYDDLVFHIQ